MRSQEGQIMPAIQITDLQKSFGAARVLKSISLNVEEGEMVALIGSSGSGKSTLMRHLSCLTLADKGSRSQIEVLGVPVQHKGRASKDIRRTRARVGNIFQQFNLVNRLSVLTNVLIGGLSRVPVWRSMLGWFTREEKLEALQALELVGLREHALKRASELSGGQQQRVAIARALMQKAEVILADEPIASLDPESSRLVMETLERINRELGITVVVTLHQVDYAQKYCRRAVALQGGEIFFDGPITALDGQMLSRLYGTQMGSEPAPEPVAASSARPAYELNPA
jgi:phosphonate transport system ATP-binding protein